MNGQGVVDLQLRVRKIIGKLGPQKRSDLVEIVAERVAEGIALSAKCRRMAKGAVPVLDLRERIPFINVQEIRKSKCGNGGNHEKQR
jgi:hypothetical protein